MASDVQRAWTGVWPESPGSAIRIEAAALAGTPVWFHIFDSWEAPPEPATNAPSGRTPRCFMARDC